MIGTTLFSDLNGDLTYTALRLAALLGYLSLSGAVIMNLFKPEIKKILGRPFLPIHHAFAITGLIPITIHPILFAILTSDLSVFFPDTSSLYFFFATGGRVAIILIYVVLLAGLFRLTLKSYWKLIHRLIYPVMIIAIIHANIMGATFQNAGIWALYNGLAIGILLTGIMRFNQRRRKLKMKK